RYRSSCSATSRSFPTRRSSDRSARAVHPVVALVDEEPQFRREAELHGLCHMVPEFPLCPVERRKRLLLALAAEGQHIGRGNPQVGRHLYLTNSDRHGPERVGMDLAAVEDLAQGPPDQLAHAELTLGGVGAPRMSVLCHALPLSKPDRGRNMGFAAGQSQAKGCRPVEVGAIDPTNRLAWSYRH